MNGPRAARVVHRIVGILAAVGAVAVSLGLAAPAALAQPIGTVIVIPGEGAIQTAIRLRTSRGCPATANAYYARMWGQGFPSDGLVATTNTKAGMSFTTGFDVYFAQTMKDFADLNGGAELGGRYDIVVYCIDRFPSQVRGQFSGALEFGTPATFRAVGESMPTGPSPPPLVVGGDGLAVEQGLASSGADGPGGSAPPDASPVPDPAGAPVQDGRRAAPVANTSGASYLPLVLIAVLLAVPAVVFGLRRRRSE